MKRWLIAIAVLPLVAGLCVGVAGAVSPSGLQVGPQGVSNLPAPAQTVIAAAQAQVDQQSGQPLVLHHAETMTNSDGTTTSVDIALPPGETSWMPGDPGPLPYFSVTTGGNGLSWGNSITSPGQLHIMEHTSNQLSSFHHRSSHHHARLVSELADGVYYCVGTPQNPIAHYGAYGTIGVVTGQDVIDCNSQLARYNDNLWLYEFELPEAQSYHFYPGNVGPLSPTIYGWLTTNETAFVCHGYGSVPDWTRMVGGMTWPDGFSETNAPAGWNSTPILIAYCSA